MRQVSAVCRHGKMGRWTTSAGKRCRGKKNGVQINKDELPPVMMVGGHKTLIVVEGGLLFVCRLAGQKGCRKGRAEPALQLKGGMCSSCCTSLGPLLFFQAATSSLERKEPLHCMLAV